MSTMTSLTGTIDVTPTEFPLSDKNSSILVFAVDFVYSYYIVLEITTFKKIHACIQQKS